MLFNSLEFLIFFPLVTLCYFLIPSQWRWLWLLFASCLFYMWAIPAYLIILFTIITIDFYAARIVEVSSGKKKKLFLTISIISNCLVLFIFKYFNFFSTNIAILADHLGLNYPLPISSLIIPIGLSIHTFQSMGYIIDVYRDDYPAERRYGRFALFVMFFPQLVAGPIERARDLIPQFDEVHQFDYDRITAGLKLMAWGMFKKAVIADNLARVVNSVYADPTGFNGLQIAVAVYLFPFQIYCDFSGYADIAIGAAQVLGIQLSPNFWQPTLSHSIRELWQRWNVTLMAWFRDYFYRSIRRRKDKHLIKQAKIVATFLVSGLWHGANWTYIIWGGINGLYLVIANWTAKIRYRFITQPAMGKYPKIYPLIQIFVTLNLLTFSLVFFRASDLSQASYIIGRLFEGLKSITDFRLIGDSLFRLYHGSYFEIILTLAVIVLLETIDILQQKGSVRSRIAALPNMVRWPFYIVFLLALILLSNYGGSNFIYFQF